MSALQIQSLLREHAVLGRKVGELGRRREAALAVELGGEPCALGQHVEIFACERTLVGAEVRRRHLDQDLAGLDLFSLADVKRGDDSPLAVLDRLAMARHGDDAAGVDAGVERRQRRPSQQHDEEEEGDSGTDADVEPRVVGALLLLDGRDERRVHDAFSTGA